MNPNFVGLRIVSVLVMTGFGLVGTPDLGIAASTDEADSKPGLLSLHKVDSNSLSPEDAAYVEAMKDHLN